LKIYNELKGNGRLDEAQWDMLTRQTHPRELLESVAIAPYTKNEETQFVKLAMSSVDTVVRFDTELSNLAAGVSATLLG
jgi:hypothetical protein